MGKQREKISPIPDDGIILDSNRQRQLDAFKFSEQGNKVVRNTKFNANEFNRKLENQYRADAQKQAETQSIVDKLNKEQRNKDLMNQNLAQESWYSGITNFFDGVLGGSIGKLTGANYFQKDGKWYKRDTGNKVGAVKTTEVPYSEVQKMMDERAVKMATSGSFQAGVGLNNAIEQFADDVLGTGYSLGALAGRTAVGLKNVTQNATSAALGGLATGVKNLLTNGKFDTKGAWTKDNFVNSNGVLDKVPLNAIKSIGNTINQKFEEANYASARLGEDLFGRGGMWSDAVNQSRLELNKYKQEGQQIQKEGQQALEDRWATDYKRRKSGDKNILDNIYDTFNLGSFEEGLEEKRQLKNTISERAMELEGRKKRAFSAEDTLSNKMYNVGDGVVIPYERANENGSKSVWDAQKLVIDANGKPVRNTDGTYQYEDKYNLLEKLSKSDFGVLTDSYYLQDDVATGVGTAASFVVGGKGINAATEAMGKVAGRALGSTAKALNLETKALNYTNKLLNVADRVAGSAGKTVGQVDRLALNKALNQVNDKISQSIRTAINSYAMSDLESEQIGRQVQSEFIKNNIDKEAGIKVDEIAALMGSQGNYESNAYLYQDATKEAERRRNQWIKENPETFNELLLRSQLAQQTARELNNINVINNLSSAGLFVKGKSFARNILNNPLSAKSIAKGAWTIGREMMQEGIIEEGLINTYAEKAGKKAGDLKFYNTTDYFDNDVASGEFMDSVFAGALLGGLQTGFTHGLEARHAYKEFITQKKIANELSKIGDLNSRNQIKKVINYSLDKTNNEAFAARINELVKEGRESEAEILADTLLLNKAVKAATSGTTDVLNESFSKLMNTPELNNEDRAELTKAISFNNKIADYYDAHVQFSNLTGILSNRANKEMMENNKKEILDSLSSLENDYNQTLDRVARQQLNTDNTDYSISNYNEILENKKQSITLNPNEHRSAFNLNQARKQINLIQNVQDELDTQYEEMISPKYQADYNKLMNEIRDRKIVESVTQENKEEVKDQLREEEKLTPALNANIEQQVEKKVVEDNIEDVNPLPSKVSTKNELPNTDIIASESIKNVPEQPAQQATTEFIKLDNDNLFGNETQPTPLSQDEIADINDALFMQPTNVDKTNPKHSKAIDETEKVLRRLNDNINNEAGRDITPREAFSLFGNSIGFGKAEQNFNLFKEAFNRLNIPQDESWDVIYDKFFGNINNDFASIYGADEVINQVENPISVQDVFEASAKANTEVQKDNTPTSYTQNNKPVVYLGRKIAAPINKIAFLGYKYNTVYNPSNNTVSYIEDPNGEINTEGSANLNVILNPDILVPGKKVNVFIPSDYKDRIVSQWTKDGNILVQNSISMGEWMSKNNIEEGSKQWIDKVPMEMIVDGVNIGPVVHDVAWWNTRNVADFREATIDGEQLSPEQASMRQRQIIEQAREIVSDIRQAVFNGNNEFIITQREQGHTLDNADNQLNSIYTSNPDAQIVIYSPDGFINGKNDNGNTFFKGKVVNPEINNSNGHVFMISRLGTEKDSNGVNVPTYVAHKLITNNNQEQLQGLAKSRQKLYDAFDILNRQGQYNNPSDEQVVWAERVKEQVRALTGISIDAISTSVDGKIQRIGLGRLRQLYPVTQTQLATDILNNPSEYTPKRVQWAMNAAQNTQYMLLPQMQNFEKQKLPIIHDDGSVTNYQSNAGTGYKAMLMDNLYTNKKFHDITDSNGNNMKVLDVQPKIQFAPSLLIAKTEIEDIEKPTIVTEPRKAPVEESAGIMPASEPAESETVEEITYGQKRRVVQYIKNNILASIDISESFTNKQIADKLSNSFNEYVTPLQNTYPSEYEYLMNNKNSIIGLGEFSMEENTVRSELESFLSQQFELENDADLETGIENDVEIQLGDEGIFEKNNSKVSYENEVRTSLSTKLKMFFSDIIKKESKSALEEFAGLPDYYSDNDIIGALQDMLVNVSNDINSFKNKIENQIQKNPDEFDFLQQVLDKFNSAPLEIQKEMLFRLNQTKNEMHFVMYSKSKDGKYTLKTFDANSKNPNIKKKLEWQENMKQSTLLNNFGDNYRIREAEAQELINQFDGWKSNYVNVPNEVYKNWLSKFGIEISDKTIDDYKTGNVEGHTNFSSNFANNSGVFGVLYNNLKKALNTQKTSPEILFSYRDNSSKENILLFNNSGFLKTMIDVDVNNTFNQASSMYIAGKSINAFSQPNYTTEQLRKIKDSDNPLTENLRNSAFSKNSMILELMENPKIKNILNVSYVSLQSLKQQGQKSFQDSDIVSLSSGDYDTLLLGFFQHEGSYFNSSDYANKGITNLDGSSNKNLREVKMTFPTLSDSSQMFLFNTVALNLNKNNFNFDGGKIGISDDVLAIMSSQLVRPDLDRIEAYLKMNDDLNIQGLNLGSQIFTMIPGLNTLSVDVNGEQVKFLSVVHESIKKGVQINDLVEQYKSDIYLKIQELVSENAEKKISFEDGEISGSWVDNGFINEGLEVDFLDNKYLNSKGTNDNKEKLQIASYDFVINYLLNQSQIQMLFAGDIANYVQDKQESRFAKDENGVVDVTRPIIELNDGENKLEKEQTVYNNILKATSVNMSKRLKELISPGNRLAESKDEQYIQIMVNDVEDSSETLSEIVKTFYPELYEENKADIVRLKVLEKQIRKGIKDGTPVQLSEKEYKTISKKLQNKFPDIRDYFNITSTDAQEYTTWKEHLNVLLNQGRLTKDLFNAINEKLESQSKDGLNENNKLSKDEKKVIFQPIKPLHAGMYFEDMGGVDGTFSKLQRYVYVKTSSFPLLPELTKGLEIDNLRKNIETLEDKKGKKVRVSYQSGNKVGAVRNAIDMSELYSDYNEDLENKIVSSSIILDRENFSIQQDKPFKTDKNIKNQLRDMVNRGTQFEKIILGNGINHITKKIFPNKFDASLLESLGIPVEDNISGQDLYKIYTGLYQREQDILRNELYNSLGLNQVGEWTDNVDTFEEIKKALATRLPNQQDKDILNLNYIRAVDGINQTYVKVKVGNGIKYKNINTGELLEENVKFDRAEFNIPIWMSPNSRKFESVLNSIVNNKLVNLKLPGYSSPVASQEGFTIQEDYDSTGVIFTGAYNPSVGLTATHNSDGSLKYAQVLVASKFRMKKRDSETGKYKDEIINLADYTKEQDGRMVLDMDRVSPDLLQQFSFRIPTSAHQSGALIEIVGFLPHSSGDLMIVPKDHTTQIGEDYDIDTRYVYSQNYRVDSKNNIKKIDSEYINAKIQQLEKSYVDENKWNTEAEDILNLFDVFANNEYIQNIFDKDSSSREKKHRTLVNSLNNLLIENQLIDVYKSVFSSDDTGIQKMIGATLSTKFAEDTAQAIDEKLNSTVNNSNFSIFSDEHQKSILRLGASGKLGIGVHSNWVTLNSLFQQLENKPQLLTQGKKGLVPMSMTIGNFTTDGTLGNIKALNPDNKITGFEPRLLSVINMESQNSATDNQKLQIMGRRNENKYTINVFALMSNLGFDKDIVNGKEMSLPSLFISQPIIRRYVELKEKYDSITNGFTANADEQIVQTLMDEFGEGVVFVNDRLDSDQMKVAEKYDLTGQRLYDSLIKGNNIQQIAVLQKFLDLKYHAQNINKIQQLANIDSSGLGISFFNTINKKDALMYNMTEDNLEIRNIENSFFGERLLLEDATEEEQQRALEEGYIHVDGEMYMKPTTPLNAKLISSIASGYNLWKNVFPFESKYISEQINDILNIAGKDETTASGLELKYKVVSNMKDYIYSYNNIGIFDNDVNTERKRLFFDNLNNESLASYLNKLKKSNHPLFNEPLFKELEFTLSRDNEPSLIKYTTDDRTNYNKNSVYNIFNILDSSKQELPNFNGETYTYEKLAKDMVKYSLLSNQENGAIGFRNYIPLSILEKYDVTKNLRTFSGVKSSASHNLLLNGNLRAILNIMGATRVTDNTITPSFELQPETIKLIKNRINVVNNVFGPDTLVLNSNNTITVNNLGDDSFKSIFTKQFFQHNPGEATKYDWKLNKNWLERANDKGLDKLHSFTTSLENKPDYISIRDSKNSTFILFEKDANNVYRKINKLGGFGLNEFSPFNLDNKSAIESNNAGVEEIQTVKPVTMNNISTQEIKNDTGLDGGVQKVIQSIIDGNSKFKEIAKILQPFIGNIPIQTLDMSGVNGIYVPLSENSSTTPSKFGTLTRGTIYISNELLSKGVKEDINYAVMEEVIHSITVDELRKYVNMNSTKIGADGNITVDYINDNPPAHIIKLVNLFKEGSKHIINKYAENSSLEDAINDIRNHRLLFEQRDGEVYNKQATTTEFRSDVYRTLNLGEFIAGVFLSESFREEMNKVQYRSSGKTILQNLADVITRLIKSIAPNAVQNSITENTISEVMNLLNHTITNPSTSFTGALINEQTKSTDSISEQLINDNIENLNKMTNFAEQAFKCKL